MKTSLRSREGACIAALAVFAALRVLAFSAAFPFFSNVDEHRHVDAVFKYARGYLPRPDNGAYESETAHHLGIEDRSFVNVSSSRGTIRARALSTERIVPGVAALPVGLGKRAGGRWARGIGSNPLRLLAPLREALSGLPDPGATRVRITPQAGAARGRES